MWVCCVGVPLLLWSAVRCALFYYALIISYLYLLVKSFYKTFSRFFANLPRFACSDRAGCGLHPWGIAAGAAAGGECLNPTRKIKRAFLHKPLDICIYICYTKCNKQGGTQYANI